MKRISSYIILIFVYSNCLSQTFIDNGELNKQFAINVKQIDELFERFNYDSSSTTFLKKYIDYNKFEISRSFDRVFFLKSIIFSDLLDTVIVNDFISNIIQSKKPIYLNFYDDDWFASISCSFDYLGKPVIIQLILKNQIKYCKQSKWVIYSVNSDIFKFSAAIDSTKSMSPMSHAVDFMTINRLFFDKVNQNNYYKRNFQPDQLSMFYILTFNDMLKFKRINSTKYYFFQIPNWYFTVEHFERKFNTSGWLISKIVKMDDTEKDRVKEEILNVKE